MDLVSGNNGSYNISVLLNLGGGNFGTSTTFTTGAQAAYLTSSDFNQDGNPDLAASSPGSNSVMVLLGNGLGGISSPNSFMVGYAPWGITSADLNGDGIPDIATSNTNSNNISILLGNGTGTFSNSSNFSVANSPTSITSADFNSDGKIDLATGNYVSGNVSVLLGTGTGSFSPPINSPVGPNGTIGPNAICSADFNGDGNADLATVNDSLSNTAWVLFGTGTGSFSTAVSYTVHTNPYSIISEDFDGDCIPDLATANGGPISSSNDISVLLGTNTGAFNTPIHFQTGANPFSIISSDFDNDGKLDMANVNLDSMNISVLLNCAPSKCINNIVENQRSVSSFFFPNPSNGNITLEYNMAENGNLEIIDVNGNLLGSYNLSSASNHMEIRNDKLSNGIYLYRVISNGATIKQGKIVILR